MLFSLIVYAAIVAIILFWIKQGFLSALLNLACVVVAGAVAFALWEFGANFILVNAPDRGFFEFLSDTAWGLGLAIPFILTMVIIRPILDKLVPANAICTDMVDSIGGFVCGTAAAILTVGIAVIAIGALRFGPSIQGYEPLVYNTDAQGRGAIVVQKQLVRPYVDEAAAAFFTYVSRTTFTPGEDSLARWYPDVHLVPASLRMTHAEGKARNTTRPKDFTVTGRYTVGDVERGEDLNRFLRNDGWTDTPQSAVDIRGNLISRGYIAGFIVNFDSSAREKGGSSQVVLGNAQVRLVVENLDGDTMTLFPIAVISQAEARANALGRWRFDASELFISSVGGSSQIPYLIEFAVPHGYNPIGLYIKGVRHNVTDPVPPDRAYPSQYARFAAVQNGVLVPGFTAAVPGRTAQVGATGQLPPADAETIRLKITRSNQPRRDEITLQQAGIAISSALSFVIRAGSERGLKVEQDGRGFNIIVDGEEVYTVAEIRANRGLDRELQISRFQTTPDTVLVQVDVSLDFPLSLLSQTALNAGNGRPSLWASNGQSFDAIGYIYEDSTTYKVRFTPGHPLGAIGEAPGLTRTNPDRKLKLIFRCSAGTEIVGFSIGGKLVASWQETPIPVESFR